MKKKTMGYISWPKAFALLQKKSPTTIEEVASWILNYPRDRYRGEPKRKSELKKLSGIRAYTKEVYNSPESRQKNAPFRFSFDPLQQSKLGDIPSHVCELFFSEREIRAFKPIDRYLTYEQVETRFSKYNILDLTSFLRGQVRAGKLLDTHPVFGSTQLSNPDATYCPAAVEAIFPKEDIDLIESQQLKGTAQNQRGSRSKKAMCFDQANVIRSENPKMSQRAIAALMSRRDDKKDDSDETKIGLTENTIRRYIRLIA